MKYSKYYGAERRGFIKSKSVLAPKGANHLLNENIRYDITIEFELITPEKSFIIQALLLFQHDFNSIESLIKENLIER
jgi:hypothetical protein